MEKLRGERAEGGVLLPSFGGGVSSRTPLIKFANPDPVSPSLAIINDSVTGKLYEPPWPQLSQITGAALFVTHSCAALS